MLQKRTRGVLSQIVKFFTFTYDDVSKLFSISNLLVSFAIFW